MSQPLVSVLVAAYNQAELIAETLESALSQSYENLEVVVSDDASEDHTTDVVHAVAERYPGRVTLVEAAERGGPCRRRNDALAAAEGELIAWLDGDDLWLPGKVEKQVAAFEANPRVGLVHTGFEKFDSETGAVVPGGVTTVPSGDLFAELFTTENFIASLTAMFRRDALDARGGRLREVEFAYGDDYWAWLQICLDWEVGAVNEVLAQYRMHDGNLSHRQGNHLLKRIALLDDFLEEYPEARKKLGTRARVGMGRQWLAASAWEREHGERGRSARYWLRGFAHSPLSPAIRRYRQTRFGLGARLGRGSRA